MNAVQKNSGEINSWIRNDTDYSFQQKEERIIALPDEWLDLIAFLSGTLRVTLQGCNVAELKGKPIPVHDLALCTLLDRSVFPSVSLNNEEALKFLRKEDFKLDLKQKGYTLVTYHDHPLGWINFLGSRFNNYYPVNWRIRMK